MRGGEGKRPGLKAGGPGAPLLAAAAAALCALSFCLGVLVGRGGLKSETVSFEISYERSSPEVYKAAEVVKININTADAERLADLPGIGEKLAERIISYRSEHGGFKYEYEIMNVPGIGEAKYGKIKDYITVK